MSLYSLFLSISVLLYPLPFFSFLDTNKHSSVSSDLSKSLCCFEMALFFFFIWSQFLLMKISSHGYDFRIKSKKSLEIKFSKWMMKTFEVGFNWKFETSQVLEKKLWQTIIIFFLAEKNLFLKKDERYIFFSSTLGYQLFAFAFPSEFLDGREKSACARAGAESIRPYVSQCAERGKKIKRCS